MDCRRQDVAHCPEETPKGPCAPSLASTGRGRRKRAAQTQPGVELPSALVRVSRAIGRRFGSHRAGGGGSAPPHEPPRAWCSFLAGIPAAAATSCAPKVIRGQAVRTWLRVRAGKGRGGAGHEGWRKQSREPESNFVSRGGTRSVGNTCPHREFSWVCDAALVPHNALDVHKPWHARAANHRTEMVGSRRFLLRVPLAESAAFLPRTVQPHPLRSPEAVRVGLQRSGTGAAVLRYTLARDQNPCLVGGTGFEPLVN